MKKKITIVAVIVAALLLVGIIGIGIYVSIPVRNLEYGITLTTSHVSAKGLKFHIEREDEKAPGITLRSWSTYKIYKYQHFRWMPVSLQAEYIYQLMREEARFVEHQSEQIYDVDWTEGCGKLSTGIYRMEREIGKPNRAEVYRVPFFVINWVQVLVSIFVTLGIAAGIWLLWRRGFWKNVAEFIVKRKKLLAIATLIIILLGIIGLIAYIKIPKKDKEWGISLQVTECSPTGATYVIERQDTKKPWDIFVGNCYQLEKITLFGWKAVEGSSMFFTAEGYILSEEYSKEWNVNWENSFGNLPSGLYRLSTEVTVEGYYKHDATGIESLELVYRAPFVIAVWWEILLIIIVILLLLLLIWLEKRYKVMQKVWAKLRQRWKRNLVIGLVCVAVILTGSILTDAIKGKTSAAYWKYEVTVTEVTPTNLVGTITYHGDEKDDISWFLRFRDNFKVQMKTWYGWKTLKTLTKSSRRYVLAVREGKNESIGFNWSAYQYNGIGELPSGTYRVVQPFALWHKTEGTKPGGEIYFTFEIE